MKGMKRNSWFLWSLLALASTSARAASDSEAPVEETFVTYDELVAQKKPSLTAKIEQYRDELIHALDESDVDKREERLVALMPRLPRRVVVLPAATPKGTEASESFPGGYPSAPHLDEVLADKRFRGDEERFAVAASNLWIVSQLEKAEERAAGFRDFFAARGAAQGKK
jgi:hypothetical protein